MNEKRSTRSSILNESNKKEEPTIESSNQSPIASTRKSTRRSDTQTSSNTNIAVHSPQTSTQIDQNNDTKRAGGTRTIKEQKSSSNLVVSMESNPSNQQPETDQKELSKEKLIEQKIEQQQTQAQNQSSNDSKIVTRRRSSNILNHLRSGSSSSLLSQSLNLGKSKFKMKLKVLLL
jgi:hypothetical protein